MLAREACASKSPTDPAPPGRTASTWTHMSTHAGAAAHAHTCHTLHRVAGITPLCEQPIAGRLGHVSSLRRQVSGRYTCWGGMARAGRCHCGGRSRDARSADPLRRVSSTSSARSNPWLSPLLRRWIGAARRHRAHCGGTVTRCPRCGSWSSGASSEVTCLAVTEGRLSGRALRVHTRASTAAEAAPRRRCGGAAPTRWIPRATCRSLHTRRGHERAGQLRPSPCSQLIRPRRRAGCRPRAGQEGTCEGTNIAATRSRNTTATASPRRVRETAAAASM